MKRLLIAFLISSVFAAPVLAENLYQKAEAPSRMAIFEKDGKYYVAGFSDGKSYADAQKNVINKDADERISSLTGTAEEIAEKSSVINGERNAAIELLDVKAAYADLAIENMKAGMNHTEAKKAAADLTLDKIPTTAGLQSGYNDGSVTSSLSSGEQDTATISNNDFKQFNELDCSYSDVSNYIDKSLNEKTKAFSTSPSYSGTFKKTASKSIESRKGEDEASCQTIFHDAKFNEMDDLSIEDLPEIPSFGEFGDMMADLGKLAGEQLEGLATDLYAVMREGFCSRMSTDYLGELAGDLIEDEYKESTKGTALDGTKINKLDKESGQNNFTYKVIKNQSGQSDSDLIKAVDVTRDDQGKYQENYFEDGLDDILDDFEDDIFGK